ncbi:uncharacterized protein LOC116419914 isoform X3 [Sarcophilus harrisii]|uniref:uncharacterized protein LOC116419914 isoform X3 n=1 Tax=Sarcophilus harrisii TaxID=9305 RepID=UPI00130207A1|nr:uncharacterized protein LOC116419914 isoform X3 [Sarcophilus harrisii]
MRRIERRGAPSPGQQGKASLEGPPAEPGPATEVGTGVRRSTESEVYDDGTNTFFCILRRGLSASPECQGDREQVRKPRLLEGLVGAKVFFASGKESPHLDCLIHPHLRPWLRDPSGRDSSGHCLQHQKRSGGQHLGFLVFWSHAG